MLPDGQPTEGTGATFPLSGDGLRNWLYTAGSSIFTEGESGAQTLDFLRLNGVQISDADFYSIRSDVLLRESEIGGLSGTLQDLADVVPDSFIPLGDTIFDSGYQLSTDFLYRYQITSYNPATDEVQTQYMAVSSDYQLTFNQARDLMGSLFTGEYVNAGFEVTDISIDAAFGNPGVL